MSKITSNAIQIGGNANPDNNFTIQTDGAGALEIRRGNEESPGEILLKLPYETEWLDLGFGTGFGPQLFGHRPQYKKVGSLVYLRGISLKTSGVLAPNDSPFGNLPEGFRPKQFIYFLQRGGGNPGGITAQLFTGEITPSTGNIIITGVPSGVSTAWVTLDGYVFSIDD